MLRAPKTARAAAPSSACATTTGPSPTLHHAAASRTPAPRGAASSPCSLSPCGTAQQQQHHQHQHLTGRAVLPVPRCLGPSTSEANGAGGGRKQQHAAPHHHHQQQHHGASSAAPVSGQGVNAAPSRAVHPELSGDGDDDLLYPEFTAYNPPQGWVKLYTPQALSSLAQQPPHQSPLHHSLTASSFAGGVVDGQWAGTFSDDEVCVPPPSNLPTVHHCTSSSSSAALPQGQSGGAAHQPHHGHHHSSSHQQQPEGPLFVPRKDMWTLTGQPGIDMLLAGPMAWGRLPQVFVILFGVGERDTEGIYSLRAFADDGLPQETIIAFESEEDAQQYAGLLEATMEHTPNVCSIPPRELLDFCVEQGYACRLEPQGSLLIPPDYNVGVTDWERSLRLREGRWAVLDEEPSDLAPSGGGISGSGGSFSGRQGATMQRIVASLQQQQQQPPSAQQQQQPSGQQQQLPGGKPQQAAGGMGGMGGISFSAALARYTPFTGDLEAIRAKLEKLLPTD